MDLTADVTIEIGELDLTGVPPARRHAVVAAFERELARLVADRPPAAGPVGHRPGEGAAPERVGARPDGDPVVFGVELARAVHRSLP